VAAGSPSERSLGPWRLLEELGRGGNATVWRAVSVDFPEPVALKVINAIHANREPYRRFIREIEFLRSLEDATGTLPLFDAHLPDKPSKVDKPWLAMPIARLLADALREQPLEVVVSALAVIAGTLARLAKDHGVAHRDIKPDNLYQLDGDPREGATYRYRALASPAWTARPGEHDRRPPTAVDGTRGRQLMKIAESSRSFYR